ncbi:MAG: amidohydrolase family protein [Clostridia bacterium]|nr:amidohydrolase family protein [Clostridia bacterium]
MGKSDIISVKGPDKMTVDFHTHIFPEKIAERALQNVLKNTPELTASTDGTLKGLEQSCEKAGVDLSVVLPVATRAGQFDHMLEFAKYVNDNGKRVISFAGIHPDDEDIYGKLDRVKESGIKGIKLHPDFQATFVDDPKYVKIVKYAVESGLIVSFHAGIDFGLPDPVHCPADRAAKLINKVYEGNTDVQPQIVLAHLAGIDKPDEVRKHLVGLPVYFDLSFIIDRADPNLIISLCREHGTDKILFGSDSPWSDQVKLATALRDMDFTEQEKRQIMGENAIKLLKI